MRRFAIRPLAVLTAVSLALTLVWQIRRGQPPPPPFAAPDGTLGTARREVLAFLRIPEPLEPGPPTLRGRTFQSVPAPPPAPKDVATRNPSEERRDPFFPEWYAPAAARGTVAGGEAPSRGPILSAGREPADGLRTAAPGATLAPSDQCQFAGTMLLRSGKPAALVKDLVTGENVLLSEGESYRGVLLVQLDFFSATFAGPSGALYRFSAVVGGQKTFPAGDAPIASRGGLAAPVDSPGGGLVRREEGGEDR
jgi:hypothetical protein